MIGNDRAEIVIRSLAPMPAGRSCWVLSVWLDEDGWFSGWAEPVLMLAVVEQNHYDIPVEHLPRHPARRREHLVESSRRIEPVVYDINSLEGFSVYSQMDQDFSAHQYHTVLSEPVLWDGITEALSSARFVIEHKRRRLAESVAEYRAAHGIKT